MSWTPPITWVPGPVTSAMLNAQVRDNLLALQAATGSGTGALFGTAPSSSTLLKTQAGTVNVSVAASNGTITFPTAFSSGLVSVVLMLAVPATTAPTQFYGSSYTLSSVTFSCATTAGAGPPNGIYQVNFIAVGW